MFAYVSQINLLYASEGGKLACLTQLAFVKTSHLKMLFVALNEMCQNLVHYLNIASVNFMRNLVFAGRKNQRLQESVNSKEGVMNNGYR